MTTVDGAAHVQALRRQVETYGPVVVAFSGGVDSTVVLKIAADVLGADVIAVTGLSPSVAPQEAERARELAADLGVELLTPETHELANPDYVANASDRCFHCKTELYDVCRRVAAGRGDRLILNGTNADDVGDWRPGLKAAAQAGVRSPLLECGLDKAAVRAAARALGLSNWDKPALACLASRLPYGTSVTPERLAAVDAVEQHLRARGFRDVRARHLGDEVRLEVEPDRVRQLLGLAADPELLATVTAAGFRTLSVEPDGYRSGRLNDVLDSPNASR